MLNFLKSVLAWFFFAFVFAYIQYVGGRILAPELGLTAPDFWPWFWFAAIVENFVLWFYLTIQKQNSSLRHWF